MQKSIGKKVQMEIKDFNELNALHKLLVTIKSSDSLSSAEIDLFAGSPFISSILKRVRKEYTVALRQQLADEHIEQWLNETKFTMDSVISKAIQTRIQNWDTSLVNRLKIKTQEDIIRIAKGYIEPLEYEKEELDKLVEFIARRLDIHI